MCVKGCWFRGLDNYIYFSQKHVPEGQFQWFFYLVSYLQFIMDEIIDVVTSQRINIQESRVKRTSEQSAVSNVCFDIVYTGVCANGKK